MPNFYLYIISRRRYDPILPTKLNSGYEVIMRIIHTFLLFTIIELPYTNRLVIRDRIKVLASGVEGQGAHPIIMTGEGS